MDCILIGYGEIGRSVKEFYGKYHTIHHYDTNVNSKDNYLNKYDIMLVAIPPIDDFVDIINKYKEKFNVENVIVFSSTPIGTVSKIKCAVHSPVEGKHPNLAESLAKWQVFVGGYNTEAFRFFITANKNVRGLSKPEHTEFMKLQSTTNYGIQIAYAKYVGEVCDDINLDYNEIIAYNMSYNSLYKRMGSPTTHRQIVTPPSNDGIHGHCILENALMLQDFIPNTLVNQVLSLGKHSDTISEEKIYFNKTWLACEHYGKKKTCVDIAKEFECTPENISAIMKRRGLKINQILWEEWEIEKLKELSKTNTFKEISKILKRTHSAIRSMAMKLAIESCYDPSIMDLDTRKKISSTLQGIEYEEWDGFVESAMHLIRTTEKYQNWRKKVFERDNYTCQECGKTNAVLNAHHILEFSKYPDKRIDVDNGLTLCVECHKNKHSKRGDK